MVLVVCFLVAGCQILAIEPDTPEPDYREVLKQYMKHLTHDPCVAPGPLDSPDWDKGQAWNTPETSCI